MKRWKWTNAELIDRFLNEHEIGDLIDNWTYAGISPTTQKPFSVASASLINNMCINWHEAQRIADNINSQGHEYARQPSLKEMQVIYHHIVKNNRYNQYTKLIAEENNFENAPFYWTTDVVKRENTTRIIVRFDNKRNICHRNAGHISYKFRTCIIRNEPQIYNLLKEQEKINIFKYIKRER